MWRRNLMIAWVAQILSLSAFGFAFPFLPFFIQELGVTDPDDLRLWTGLISSAPALSMAVMAPIWGVISDRFGKKIMLLRAMLFGAVILVTLSLAQSARAVFLLRIAQGALTGTMTASAALIATGTPRAKLSYALGMLSSSNFIGISLGPLIGGLAAERFGYRPSFIVGAVVMLAGFVLVLTSIHESSTDGADEADVAPDADSTTARGSDRPDVAKRVATSETGDGAAPATGWRSLLTTAIVGSLVMLLLLRFARALPVPFLPLHIQEMRGRLEGSASVTGLISAGRGAVTALAAVTITRLGDRHSKLRIVTVLLALATVFSIPVAFARSVAWFAVLIIVATFFLGGIEPLLQADLSSRVAPGRRGMLFGMTTTIGNLGWFAAPLVGSAVSIATGIHAVFLTLAVFLGITMSIALTLYLHGTRHARQS